MIFEVVNFNVIKKIGIFSKFLNFVFSFFWYFHDITLVQQWGVVH